MQGPWPQTDRTVSKEASGNLVWILRANFLKFFSAVSWVFYILRGPEKCNEGKGDSFYVFNAYKVPPPPTRYHLSFLWPRFLLLLTLCPWLQTRADLLDVLLANLGTRCSCRLEGFYPLSSQLPPSPLPNVCSNITSQWGLHLRPCPSVWNDSSASSSPQAPYLIHPSPLITSIPPSHAPVQKHRAISDPYSHGKNLRKEKYTKKSNGSVVFLFACLFSPLRSAFYDFFPP